MAERFILRPGQFVVRQEVERLDSAAELGEEFARPAQVVFARVHVRDQGHAHPDGRARRSQPAEVGQDQFVSEAGPFPVRRTVHMLEIKKPEIDVRTDRLEGLPRSVASGFDGGVQTLGFCQPQDRFSEDGLQ